MSVFPGMPAPNATTSCFGFHAAMYGSQSNAAPGCCSTLRTTRTSLTSPVKAASCAQVNAHESKMVKDVMRLVFMVIGSGMNHLAIVALSFSMRYSCTFVCFTSGAPG